MSDAPSRSARRIESGLLTAEGSTSRRSEAVAIVVLAAAFGAVAGPVGLLAGIAAAVVWYAAGTPYAIAAGHVLLAARFADGVDAVSFAIVETAFLGLLVAPFVRLGGARRSYRTVRPLAVALLAALSLGGAAWLAARAQPTWVAGSVTLGALALASYGLHRYELVAFGLVDEAAEGGGTGGAGEGGRDGGTVDAGEGGGAGRQTGGDSRTDTATDDP